MNTAVAIYMLTTSLSIALLALAGGLSLYIWSKRTQGPGTQLAKVFGVIIILTAFLPVFGVYSFSTNMGNGGMCGKSAAPTKAGTA